MSSQKRFGADNADIARARSFIRSSGSGSIARSYFKETHCSVENAEIESKGLYCFEKAIRLAFIQVMEIDEIFGTQPSFIDYINGLSTNFEAPIISDWSADESSSRASDFMISFYNIYSYQWKRHGRSIETSLVNFLIIMRECLDFSYTQLSERFNSLPKDIVDNIDKAFFLTNTKIDAWFEERSAELPAA